MGTCKSCEELRRQLKEKRQIMSAAAERHQKEIEAIRAEVDSENGYTRGYEDGVQAERERLRNLLGLI